ncbi:MAG: hypothetical protein KJ042_18180 [Deltaproteobacteria bacterium]|nr:hypothetical protein [Deltaproteobacteria bacterium]
MAQYRDFQASQLFCPHCRAATEVREVLLLVLPGKNLYDYRCRKCGKPIGSREEADANAFAMRSQPAAAPPSRRALPMRAPGSKAKP